MFKVVIVLISLLMSSLSYASIVISGTRVVYVSSEKEVSVKLSNRGDRPVLVQSWIDNGDTNAKPDSVSVPFVLTPPINRVDGGKGQTLRIMYTGSNLPQDRESVFWLNVLEIPAKNESLKKENHLQMAFKTRIKLFYRPVNLSGSLDASLNKKVSVNFEDQNVEIVNDGPYFISLSKVHLNVDGNSVAKNGTMIPPFSSEKFYFVESDGAAKNSTVKIEYINDYGAIHFKEYKLN